MTKIKASVTALNPAGTVPDQVVRRAPSMPSSIPPECEPEYRRLMGQLVAMPDWNNSRLHLVEGFILALHAMRTGKPMERITAGNAVLRFSRALGIVHRNPVTLKPAPSHPKTLPLFPSSDPGDRPATGAARAPWSRAT